MFTFLLSDFKERRLKLYLVFNSHELWSDLCFVRPYQDAFDAVGYFHLALAAAMEDRANPEALYVVYMKLAEIHGNHMPDAQLCQVYRARAQSLKRVLAGEENMFVAESDNSDPDVECTNIPSPAGNGFKDNLFPSTCEEQQSAEDACSDINNVGKRSDSHCEAFMSETDTIGSRSHSESILTESFDTAKEQISDSCSSSDTLQTDRSHADEKDFGNGHHLSSHIAHIPDADDVTGHTYTPKTERNDPKDPNTLDKVPDTDPLHEDVRGADADNMETFDAKL